MRWCVGARIDRKLAACGERKQQPYRNIQTTNVTAVLQQESHLLVRRNETDVGRDLLASRAHGEINESFRQTRRFSIRVVERRPCIWTCAGADELGRRQDAT